MSEYPLNFIAVMTMLIYVTGLIFILIGISKIRIKSIKRKNGKYPIER